MSAAQRPWTGYLVVAFVAVLILAVGLGRFGFWDGTELQVAGAMTDETGHDTLARPPLQVALARLGFRLGRSEQPARLPTAVFAILAALALAGAVGRVTDVRTGAMVGLAYATLPLVFENSRQIMGGGVAQSGFTIALAGAMFALWGRAGPGASGAVRWLGLLGFVVGALAAGWMLGALPILLAVGFAVALRWSNESKSVRSAGAAYLVLAALVAIMVARAALKAHDAYDPWTGAGPDARAPSAFLSYDAILEQLGHGLYPWTGIALFSVIRLLVPASIAPGASAESLEDTWRETGVRTVAMLALVLGYGVQSFYLQLLGSIPFVAAAPIAVAIGLTLRDAEREAQPWRMVTAGATFFVVILMRDHLLFPKSTYGALGIADTGQVFPTGAHFHTAIVAVAGCFILVALSSLYLGAGPVAPIPWTRPFTWLGDVQRRAREQGKAESADYGTTTQLVRIGVFEWLGWTVAGVSVLIVLIGILGSLFGPTTLFRSVALGLVFHDVGLLVLIYAVIALWNFVEYVGRPGTALTRIVGSRIAYVFVGAIVCAMILTQWLMPALSKHFSPRDVWLAARRLRTAEEPVARYGGTANDPAARLYANFDVRPISNEREAVDWLRMRSIRHFLIVNTGAEVFPPLNRAFRRAQPEASRANITIVDDSNSNLFLAASDPVEGASHDPLDSVVMTNDSLRGTEDEFHLHGRWENNHVVPEPARFDDSIEYIGYNLYTGGTPYVRVGGTFTIIYHFHVLREMTGNQQVFVHLDGQCPRVNGDHDPAGGKYPLRFWLAGDYIHDEQRLQIPGYCRPGRYQVFIGFFAGDNRMHVNGGDHDHENRVVAANLDVR